MRRMKGVVSRMLGRKTVETLLGETENMRKVMACYTSLITFCAKQSEGLVSMTGTMTQYAKNRAQRRATGKKPHAKA